MPVLSKWYIGPCTNFRHFLMSLPIIIARESTVGLAQFLPFPVDGLRRLPYSSLWSYTRCWENITTRMPCPSPLRHCYVLEHRE